MPEFQNPAAFLLLFLIPLLFVLRSLGIFTRISFPLTLADWNGKTFEWNAKIRNFASMISRIFVILGYCASVAALADPVVYHQKRVYTSRGTDVLFVLDTSPSMAAKDIAGGTRLDAAKQAIRTLVNTNGGFSFGLVAMASEAAVIVPPTTDHDIFLARLDSVTTGNLGEGSAIGTGLSTAVYHLASSGAPRKCIVLITDGENNAGEIHPDTAAQLAGSKGIILYTLGIGTRGSVPLDYVDPKTGRVYSGYLESGFDSVPLKHIAALAGGKYFDIRTLDQLTSALTVISSSVNVIQTYHLKTTNDSYYGQLLIAAGICFALAYIIRRIYLREFI